MAAPQPSASILRRNLRASTIDALGFSVMVGIGETYFPAFALAGGLSEVFAGLVASVPILGGALLQLASTRAVRALRSHRKWVVLCASLQAASFIPLIMTAWSGRLSPFFVLAIVSLYWATGLATGPAWNTWIGRIVPRHIRPTFFARRSRLAQAAVLAGLVAGAALLHTEGASPAPVRVFVWLFAAAGLGRALSSAFLARQTEPPLSEEHLDTVPAATIWSRFRDLRSGNPLAFMLALQVAVYIAGPFFTPFMLVQLGLSYWSFVLLVAGAFVGRIIALPTLGTFARAHGAHRLLWLGSLGLLPLPLFWVFFESVPILLLTQLFAGFAWGAYELATFLLFFDKIPEEERATVLTVFNLGNSMALVLGSLLGAGLFHVAGGGPSAYALLFVVSTATRALALPLLGGITVVPVVPAPPATRVVALRSAIGAVERPILSNYPGEEGGSVAEAGSKGEATRAESVSRNTVDPSGVSR
ncbi:MAG: MFS transporter [Planctomycetota bacterium]